MVVVFLYGCLGFCVFGCIHCESEKTGHLIFYHKKCEPIYKFFHQKINVRKDFHLSWNVLLHSGMVRGQVQGQIKEVIIIIISCV